MGRRISMSCVCHCDKNSSHSCRPHGGNCGVAADSPHFSACPPLTLAMQDLTRLMEVDMRLLTLSGAEKDATCWKFGVRQSASNH